MELWTRRPPGPSVSQGLGPCRWASKEFSRLFEAEAQREGRRIPSPAEDRVRATAAGGKGQRTAASHARPHPPPRARPPRGPGGTLATGLRRAVPPAGGRSRSGGRGAAGASLLLSRACVLSGC